MYGLAKSGGYTVMLGNIVLVGASLKMHLDDINTDKEAAEKLKQTAMANNWLLEFTS